MLRSVINLLKIPLAQPIRSNMTSFNSNKLGSLALAFNSFHTTSKLRKAEDRRQMMDSMPKIDEGTEGEKHIDIDTSSFKLDMFPDEDTPNRLFNGVPFKEIPIIHIRVSHNNTIIGLTDYKGHLKMIRSCGVEGFKNTRKGTNIAAQATAITLSTKAQEQGFKTVRVRVRGLGPGRMSAIKGLQMGGLDIVSVTDCTRVTWNPLRPRKARSGPLISDKYNQIEARRSSKLSKSSVDTPENSMYRELHSCINVNDPQRLESVCCVIQGIYSEILVYIPGSRGLAQPTPDDTTPTTIVPSPTTVLPTIKGPPLSAYI